MLRHDTDNNLKYKVKLATRGPKISKKVSASSSTHYLEH